MRTSTALALTIPSFAELAIWASSRVYPNFSVVFLAPLMAIAFLLLIVGFGLASKHHERMTRTSWGFLSVAAISQIWTLIWLGAFH